MTHRLKFDAALREQFLDAIRAGARRTAAAKSVGVNPKTVYLATCASNGLSPFGKEVVAAEHEADELVEDALFQAAVSGNVTACQVWLYNRASDRWRDQRNTRTEVSGPAGTPIPVKVNVDDLMAKIRRLAALEAVSVDDPAPGAGCSSA